MTQRAQGVIARWGDRLALPAAAPRISLGEGDTPCVESLTIGPSLGLASLHFKLEGLNPTGSFKDRGMVVAVAAALHEGSRAIICASTGNTSASAAAYGGRFGLRTVVVVPRGHIASGKLVQARVHGATVVSINAGFDVALRIVRELCEHHPVTLVNSVNPNRIEGQKTAAFEIVDELGDAPDVLALPVGNAGNITAYWRGFREEHRDGRATPPAADVRRPGRGSGAAGPRTPGRRPADGGNRDSHRQPRVVAGRDRRARSIRGHDRRRSTMTRSSTRSGGWPASRGSSANRRRRHRSRCSSAPSPKGLLRPGPVPCASSPAMG